MLGSVAPLSFVVILLSFVSHVISTASPSVTIGAGTLTGGQCQNSSGAVYYKSIPYAKPPTGSLRFAAPQAYNGHFPGGRLNATRPAPACIQFGQTFAETGPTSEDW